MTRDAYIVSWYTIARLCRGPCPKLLLYGWSVWLKTHLT